MKLRLYTILLLLFLTQFSCKQDDSTSDAEAVNVKVSADDQYFEAISADHSKVFFGNVISETESNNRFTYEYFYNGGGVALGDVNNDGLADIFLTGNQVQDKLYLNQGDFEFKDITQSSGIGGFGGWSTGVNFVDINNDGLLDIYVCRSGPGNDLRRRRNLLFINQGDETFKESAKMYGLDNANHSVQAAFFDYDLDGDLDMYLLNHPSPTFKPKKKLTDHISDVKSGRIRTDVFYENVNGKYIDKSNQANVKYFGYRHGIAVSDFNSDGYPDLYISSDFDEPDILLYNTGDGKFVNKIEEQIRHTSNFSMGNDVADVNNDGLDDIFVVDMTPNDHKRSKQNMASMNPDKFYAMEEFGFGRQYMVNTLQLNQGNGNFSEVAQMAGISKTDWSWAPLFMDINNDGYKDLFVTNGVKRDVLNNDVRIRAQEKMKELNRPLQMTELLDMIPTTLVQNKVYLNQDGLKFKDVSNKKLKGVKLNSNGAAYADLDLDGDLDMVVNNVDELASIFKNHAKGNYIRVKLKGGEKNPFAMGAKIECETEKGLISQMVYNARGYLSSVEYPIHLGLPNANSIDLRITWPDQEVSVERNVEVNKSYEFDYNNIEKSKSPKVSPKALLSNSSGADFIDFQHNENPYKDFENEILLPYKLSQNGPFITSGDVNNDGAVDIFIGGAAGQAGSLYVQNSEGKFQAKSNKSFVNDSSFEDLGSVFVDYDKDGDLDLYVVSGSSETNLSHRDRLYNNDGSGNFTRTKGIIPDINASGQLVLADDIDNDGDQDLFVGGRVEAGKYPQAPESYLLINENGRYTDGTEEFGKELSRIGMITSGEFYDYDNDGDNDLIVVGEWMPVTIFNNNGGTFTKADISGLNNTRGLWFGLKLIDFDGDGDKDLFVGNLGLNSKFKVDGSHSFHLFANDFDDSGTLDIVLSKDYEGELVPVRGKECSTEQMPFLQEKYKSYKSFSEASLEEILGKDKLENALHLKVDLLESVYFENTGDGQFKMVTLPFKSQLAPIKDFEMMDVDKDGSNEIIAVGNLFGSEVETVSYDASYGIVMDIGANKELSVLPNIQTGFYTSGDTRCINKIKIKDQDYILVANNNGQIDVFTTN